jgi:integrase
MTPADLIVRSIEAELVPSSDLPLPRELSEEAIQFAEASISENTKKAYLKAWKAFHEWCLTNGRADLPAHPETVTGYLAYLAKRTRFGGTKKLALATIRLALASISQVHFLRGYPSPRKSPDVFRTMEGIIRGRGEAQKGKEPLLDTQVPQILEKLPESLLGVRDRALLTLGFAGAFRRSELVALNVESIRFVDDGMVVSLRRSKTNQRGREEIIGIPFGSKQSQCPVRSLQAWLEASGIKEGAIFRPISRHGKLSDVRMSDYTVAQIVKKYASAALGLEASEFAGHSLRVGFVTSALMHGHGELDIASQTRHKDLNMIRRYNRRVDLFKRNPAKGLL